MSAKDYLDGVQQLIDEGEARQYYYELDLELEREFDERFADYTEQQYFEEQVYGPKQ